MLLPCQALYRRHRQQVLSDPTDGLDLPEAGGRRERAVSPARAERLLEALPEAERAVWATAFYAGLHRGKLLGLRASDVGPESIAVERGWDDFEGAIDPKSRAGVRRVPLPERLQTILVAHLERTRRRGDELLFGRTPRAPFTPSHVEDSADEAWAAAAVGAFLRGESSGFERVTPHECRHSYSTWLDAAGPAETRADRYMGHSNPSVAARYRHQLAGQLADDAARLDEYLVGAGAGKVVPLIAGATTGAAEPQTRVAAQTG